MAETIFYGRLIYAEEDTLTASFHVLISRPNNRTGNYLIRWLCAAAIGMLCSVVQGAELQTIRYEDGGVYEGQVDESGNRDGRGVYSYRNGSNYEGDWQNGVKNGRGVFQWPSGNVYIGQWRDNREHGNGVLLWADGGVTEGRWHQGKLASHVPWRPATRFEQELFDRSIGKFPRSNEIVMLEKAVAAESKFVSAGPITVSRLFAGPGQYPPTDFAAYGMVAFPSRPTPQDRERHLKICSAYVAALPHISESRRPRREQMVTIWPVESDVLGDKANDMWEREEVCDHIVDKYGLVTAQQAISDAELTGASIRGEGPFLLAWSPASTKGTRNNLVLVLDLSKIKPEQTKKVLRKWADDIEKDPALWKQGWDVERLRSIARNWFDDVGMKLLQILEM